MDPHRETASLWLTRPSDIAIHLACAAAEKRPVTLTGSGLAANGLFVVPERSGPLFSPDPKRPMPLRRVGATVKAEYFTRGDAFSFFSRLVSVDTGGRWVLQSPLAVERCDRRISTRRVVVGVSGFCLRLSRHPGQPLLGLYDVSELGAAFVADPRRHLFHQEDIVDCALHLPGETPMEVKLEIRHSREFPRQSNLRIYGTRFVDPNPLVEAELSAFLSGWHGGGQH